MLVSCVCRVSACVCVCVMLGVCNYVQIMEESGRHEEAFDGIKHSITQLNPAHTYTDTHTRMHRHTRMHTHTRVRSGSNILQTCVHKREQTPLCGHK